MSEPESNNQGSSSNDQSERHYTLSEISQKTGISMPTLQRYKKMYQSRIPAQGKGRKQRYPESALPVFEELRNENAGRRGRPRKDASAPAKASARGGRTAAKSTGRGRKAGSKRAAAAAPAAPAPAAKRGRPAGSKNATTGRKPGRPAGSKNAATATGRKPGRPAGRRSGGGGNLMTLTQVSEQTGISYPTLVRYVRLHSDRLPSEGAGRARRFYPQAVEVFRSLRQESGRGGRKKGSGAAAKTPRGRAAKSATRGAAAATTGADPALAQRLKAVEKAQADLDKRLRGFAQSLQKLLR
ncbi:MAG TPA: hypothetical protein VHU81_04735 [Thermoanaerobaculia bacterium]|jgi:DNA-binding transcriptional MerR regulator|nr:hypothetical protein [Thermoanaerobaculia bacterium]